METIHIPLTPRYGDYRVSLADRTKLAFTASPYHPEKVNLGFVDMAPRYTKDLDWGKITWSESAVEKVFHAINELAGLGTIVIGDDGWGVTEQAIQIGVLWPQDRVPQGVFMRGLAWAPKHRMSVCLKTITPRDAHEFQAKLMNIPDAKEHLTDLAHLPNGVDQGNAVHTRLSQVMHRLTGFVTNCDANHAGAFGIEGESSALNDFLMSAHYERTHGETNLWEGRIYSPSRCLRAGVSPDSEMNDRERRGWEMGEAIFNTVSDLTTDSDEEPAPLGQDDLLSELPPIYKERRASLHINLGGDFWVEETRCPACSQRLIIHAPSSLCPSGRPAGLTVKCGDCKHSFGWP